jgi:hypothetical protein
MLFSAKKRSEIFAKLGESFIDFQLSFNAIVRVPSFLSIALTDRNLNLGTRVMSHQNKNGPELR